MTEYKENIDYTLIPDDSFEGRAFDAIKIIREPYKDIILRIGMLKFTGEENTDGTMPVQFDYELISLPVGIDKITLEGDEKFSRFLGDILMSILEDQLGEKGPDAGEFKARDADPEDVKD